jgi:hypothetical protein
MSWTDDYSMDDIPPFELNDDVWRNYLKNHNLPNNKPDKGDMVMSKYIPLLKSIL